MPATEATNMAKEIRYSTEAKTANEMYKQAKKMYGLGSKEQALTYLKKAQKLYETCLKKAEKHANMIDSERTVKSGGVEDKFAKKVTENGSIARVIDLFEDRIDSCKALEMQWNNKAGNSTYKETKAQLKAERKATRKQNRLNAAKERAGKRAANQLNGAGKSLGIIAYKEKMAAAKTREEREAVESMFELMEATEAFASELLVEYELSYAMESDGIDEVDSSGGLSENEQKLQDLYSQFMEAKDAGDTDRMNQLTGEIQKILDTVSKEAADAYTEDDLKAADRKLAKCLAIGGAVVATGAVIGVGIKTGAFGKVAEIAKAQAKKLRESKGANKSETGKGKGIINSIKSALGNLKGKFKKKPGTESFIDDMTYYEFEASMESLMDFLELELATEAAMEADGEEGIDESGESSTKSASGIGAKLRAAFGKLKKAKAEGNTSEVNAAVREVNEATEELSEAIDEAETPEKKSKYGKAIKIGLAAAGTAAAAVGLVALAKSAKNAASKEAQGLELSKGERLLVNAANAIKSVKVKPNQMDMSVSEKISAARDKRNKITSKRARSWRKRHGLESVLSAMAFGLEGVLVDGEDLDDDDYIEPWDGKGFDPDAQGEDMIDDAIEAIVTVMALEDGIDDSDLM
jgi:hypothetical protein